jgi:hypothetical protein
VNTEAFLRALEGVGRDLRYALRSFRRTPLVALTIVTTVALGLGLVAVVFTLLNLMVFRADVRSHHQTMSPVPLRRLFSAIVRGRTALAPIRTSSRERSC